MGALVLKSQRDGVCIPSYLPQHVRDVMTQVCSHKKEEKCNFVSGGLVLRRRRSARHREQKRIPEIDAWCSKVQLDRLVRTGLQTGHAEHTITVVF
mmetsp:Transcript_28889/g.56119  ORF Transcript_28889/g.56119 Transcript_28889/m.56119 type:complete len:96 (-) Transcript_28889:232-519(-)